MVLLNVVVEVVELVEAAEDGPLLRTFGDVDGVHHHEILISYMLFLLLRGHDHDAVLTGRNVVLSKRSHKT